MKKSFLLIIICCLLLSGCAGAPTYKNAVMPMALSADQKEIVDLLSGAQQEILLFSFQTEAGYANREVWMEVYEYGKLTESPSLMSMPSDAALPLSGSLAVVLTHTDEGIGWAATFSEGGTRAIYMSSDPIMGSLNGAALGRGFGPLSHPVEITPGKEIVLYASLHSFGGISMGDLQAYIGNPAALSGYPFAFLIKCKFS